jgi:hypothetical protein
MNTDDIKHLDLLALFHYIVGGITALFSCMPFGTILGVFTLIALNKDSIKDIFAERHAPPLPSEGAPSEGR